MREISRNCSGQLEAVNKIFAASGWSLQFEINFFLGTLEKATDLSLVAMSESMSEPTGIHETASHQDGLCKLCEEPGCLAKSEAQCDEYGRRFCMRFQQPRQPNNQYCEPQQHMKYASCIPRVTHGGVPPHLVLHLRGLQRVVRMSLLGYIR